MRNAIPGVASRLLPAATPAVLACKRASRLSRASIHICLQPRAMRSYHALALGVAFLLVILALIVLIGHLHWNSGPCTFPSWNSTEYALHPDLDARHMRQAGRGKRKSREESTHLPMVAFK